VVVESNCTLNCAETVARTFRLLTLRGGHAA
jgi:hypothetical protein